MKKIKRKYFIFITTGLFFISFIVGYQSPKSIETKSSSINVFYENVKSMTVKDVILTNSKSNALNVIGIFTLGLLPIANISFNGWFLGYYYSGALRDLTLKQIVLSTAPHFIEIGVLLYTASISLYYSFKIVLYFLRKINIEDTISLKVFSIELMICFLIIVLSAYIEMNYSIYQHR